MALVISHAFTCPIADDPGDFAAGKVTPSRWNAALSTSMATNRVLGRVTAGSGPVEELSPGDLSAFLALGSAAFAEIADFAPATHTHPWTAITSTPTTLSGYGITDGVPTSRTISTTAPLAGGGDLSANRTLSINTNGITNSLFRQSTGLSVVGRSANTTGDVADISAGSDGHVLRRSGTTLGFGTLASGAFASNTIPVGSISMSTSRLLGRTTAGSGSAEEITVSAPLTLSSGALGASVFTASTSGIVPASGGGTSNFLRADGTWAAPGGGGGGGSPGGSNKQVQFNDSGSFGGAARVNIESGDLHLLAVSAVPANPSDGNILFSDVRAQRALLFSQPAGVEAPRPYMPAYFGSRLPVQVGLASGTTAPVTLGGTLTTAATMSFQFSANSTNRWTSTPRKRYATSTTAGTATGCRMAYTQFYRGNAAGYGGFFFAARFGQNINLDGAQLFVGMCASTAVLGGEPSALLNMIGMGYDSTHPASGNWRLMHNDGTGAATVIDLGSDFARSTDQGFDLYIYNPPNSSNFHVEIVNILTGVRYTNTISTDVPNANTGLTWKCEVRNGGVSAAANIEHNYIYVEPLS